MNDSSEVWWIKPALAVGVLVIFLTVLGAVLFVRDMDSLKLIVGAVIGFVGFPLGFYFGSSSGSARKDATIAASVPAVAPVPVVAPPVQ